MQFFITAIHVALVVLTVWWIRRGWYTYPTLSQRLDTAGGKMAIGLVAAYFVPMLLLAGFGPLSRDAYDALTIGGLAFAAVAFILFIAARAVKTREGFLSRSAQRLSGHLVPPNLWPAWGVATVTGVVMFFVIFVANFSFVFLSSYIVTLQGLSSNSNSMFQAANQNFVIGTTIAWVALVALMWAIQKVTIYTAERDYRQLSVGIENRLAQQRQELLADRDADSANEQK